MGGLEGHIGLPALQPVPCSSRSYVGGEGHGPLAKKYTWSIGCCATWCNTPVPLCPATYEGGEGRGGEGERRPFLS